MNLTTWLWLIPLAAVGIIAVMWIGQSANSKMLRQRIEAQPDFNPSSMWIAPNGSSAIAIDNQHMKLCVATLTQPARVFTGRQIIQADVLENGVSVTRTSRMSQAGNAVVGGVLFGGIGAAVGALSSKTTTVEKIKKIELRVIVEDVSQSVYMINFFSADAEKGGNLHSVLSQHANEWLGRIKVLIKTAEAESHVLKEEPRTSESRLHALERLASLRRDGTLTETEFQTEKERLFRAT